MKKFPLMALSLLCALPAFAENQQVDEVPNDAALLYQTREGSIQDVMLNIRKTESNLDLDFKCQSVTYKWASRSQTFTDGELKYVGGQLNPMNWGRYWTIKSYSVAAYCQQRSYDQKVVVSLERHCEQNPTAECLDEKVKSAIQTIQPTARYDIDKP